MLWLEYTVQHDVSIVWPHCKAMHFNWIYFLSGSKPLVHFEDWHNIIGVLMWHKMQLGSAFRVKLAFTIFFGLLDIQIRMCGASMLMVSWVFGRLTKTLQDMSFRDMKLVKLIIVQPAYTNPTRSQKPLK